MRRKNIEAEGGELIIQSEEGHYAIIPAKDRKHFIDNILGCDNCINKYIQKLPKESDYAQDGTVIPNQKNVQVLIDGEKVTLSTASDEYKELYDSGKLMNYDEDLDLYVAPPLSDEVNITAKNPEWIQDKKEYQKNNLKSK